MINFNHLLFVQKGLIYWQHVKCIINIQIMYLKGYLAENENHLTEQAHILCFAYIQKSKLGHSDLFFERLMIASPKA